MPAGLRCVAGRVKQLGQVIAFHMMTVRRVCRNASRPAPVLLFQSTLRFDFQMPRERLRDCEPRALFVLCRYSPDRAINA
jgi:hypothetical protein